jgi:hypothetical protein
MAVTQEPGTIACHVNGTTGAFINNFGFVSAHRDLQGNYTLGVPPDYVVQADVFPVFSIIGSTGREAVGMNSGVGPPPIWAIIIWADAGGGQTVDRDFYFELRKFSS